MAQSSLNAPIPQRALLKIPRQPRSVAMVHSILDAGMVVIQEEGLAAMSTNCVAERAGISIGSLYQYFANRDSILAGIIERSLLDFTGVLERVQQSTLNVPLVEGLQLTLTTLLRYYDPWLEILRRIVREAPLLADNGMLQSMERQLVELFYDYLLHNSSRYRLVGGRASVHVAVSALVYLYLRWLVLPFPRVQEAEFVESAVRLFASILEEVPQAGEPHPAADHP